MKLKKLSLTQKEALAKMRITGTLYRRAGGMWTAKSACQESPAEMIAKKWFVTIPTLRALHLKGYCTNPNWPAQTVTLLPNV